MYLRLKPWIANRFDADLDLAVAAGELSLRQALIKRHYASFDWSHGGQLGRLKFVDSHQLEYAVRRALAGEHLARLMVDVTMDGICGLIGRDGGASQYATGGGWNDRNRAYRLDGQAVVMQAFAWHGLIEKQSNAHELGSRLAKFVAANADSLGLLAVCPPLGSQHTQASISPRIRDNAWYAVALEQFSHVFADKRLARVAGEIFQRCLAFHQGNSSPRRCAIAQPTLDDQIAFAAAMTHFGMRDHDRVQIRRARELVLATANRYRCDSGGYGQLFRRRLSIDQTIDLDCTIEIVRLASILKTVGFTPGLKLVVAHGLAALAQPKFALARPCESGILLFDLECEPPPTDRERAIVAGRNFADPIITDRSYTAISGALEEIG